MDETQVKFGDKLFLYGTYLQFLPEDGEFEYNTVKGQSITNISVMNVEQQEVAGFVVDLGSIDSLTSGTAFSNLVDVTTSVTRQGVAPSGTKIWMPIQSALGY